MMKISYYLLKDLNQIGNLIQTKNILKNFYLNQMILKYNKSNNFNQMIHYLKSHNLMNSNKNNNNNRNR